MKQIIADGPQQTVNRYEKARGKKATKTIKTKILECDVCHHQSVVPAKPSVLSKALQSPCRACERARVAREAQEALEARQRRAEEALRKAQEKAQKRELKFDRLCKYCGVQWRSDVVLRGSSKGHGQVCGDCRKARASQHHRLTKYDLTRDELEAMFPEGKAVCQNPGCSKELLEKGPTRDETAVIDHCHTTNKVRGVLCTQCNIALGLLGESAARILGLHVYLEESL